MTLWIEWWSEKNARDTNCRQRWTTMSWWDGGCDRRECQAVPQRPTYKTEHRHFAPVHLARAGWDDDGRWDHCTSAGGSHFHRLRVNLVTSSATTTTQQQQQQQQMHVDDTAATQTVSGDWWGAIVRSDALRYESCPLHCRQATTSTAFSSVLSTRSWYSRQRQRPASLTSAISITSAPAAV